MTQSPLSGRPVPDYVKAQIDAKAAQAKAGRGEPFTPPEPPVDQTRRTALQAALAHADGTDMDAAEVVEVAETFRKFLAGEPSA